MVAAQALGGTGAAGCVAAETRASSITAARELACQKQSAIVPAVTDSRVYSSASSGAAGGHGSYRTIFPDLLSGIAESNSRFSALVELSCVFSAAVNAVDELIPNLVGPDHLEIKFPSFERTAASVRGLSI